MACSFVNQSEDSEIQWILNQECASCRQCLGILLNHSKMINIDAEYYRQYGDMKIQKLKYVLRDVPLCHSRKIIIVEYSNLIQSDARNISIVEKNYMTPYMLYKIVRSNNVAAIRCVPEYIFEYKHESGIFDFSDYNNAACHVFNKNMPYDVLIRCMLHRHDLFYVWLHDEEFLDTLVEKLTVIDFNKILELPFSFNDVEKLIEKYWTEDISHRCIIPAKYFLPMLIEKSDVLIFQKIFQTASFIVKFYAVLDILYDDDHGTNLQYHFNMLDILCKYIELADDLMYTVKYCLTICIYLNIYNDVRIEIPYIYYKWMVHNRFLTEKDEILFKSAPTDTQINAVIEDIFIYNNIPDVESAITALNYYESKLRLDPNLISKITNRLTGNS